MTKGRKTSSSTKGFSRVSPENTRSPPVLRPRQQAEKGTGKTQEKSPQVEPVPNVARPEQAEIAAAKEVQLYVSLPPSPGPSSKGDKPEKGMNMDQNQSQQRKYAAEVFIPCNFRGNLRRVNKEFEEYEPEKFICEFAKTGTKVRLSSLIDLENYQAVLQRNHIPFSLGIDKTKKRPFKIVIKGIDSNVDPSDVRDDLSGLGFEVEKVVNMTSFKTKKPLPMFLADLKDGPTVCEALNIKSLSYYRVKVELYKKKRVPPQCSICQMFKHTAGRCRALPMCRKCAGSHHTKDCQERGQPKCALCSGDHPANYRGCPKFKEITAKKPVESRNSQTSRTTKQKPAVSRAEITQNVAQTAVIEVDSRTGTSANHDSDNTRPGQGRVQPQIASQGKERKPKKKQAAATQTESSPAQCLVQTDKQTQAKPVQFHARTQTKSQTKPVRFHSKIQVDIPKSRTCKSTQVDLTTCGADCPMRVFNDTVHDFAHFIATANQHDIDRIEEIIYLPE